MARNYRKEYDNFHSKPEQIKKRDARNAARAAMKKRLGEKALRGKDVDHAKPFAKGGTNDLSNLRLRSPKSNRSFKRNKKAGMA